jgi:hypothetical protein
MKIELLRQCKTNYLSQMDQGCLKINKNCLDSFQVLWNKNCTIENEEIMIKNNLKLKSKETNKIRAKK